MKWTEEKAIKSLRDNKAIVQGKSIAVTRETGIRLWGAVDYLCRVHGYRWVKQ